MFYIHDLFDILNNPTKFLRIHIRTYKFQLKLSFAAVTLIYTQVTESAMDESSLMSSNHQTNFDIYHIYSGQQNGKDKGFFFLSCWTINQAWSHFLWVKTGNSG